MGYIINFTAEQQSILTTITNIQEAITAQNKISADNSFSNREKNAAIEKAAELNAELSSAIKAAEDACVDKMFIDDAIARGW